MEFCLYYQAHVRKERAWFLVGILKSFEHMAFDRTIDKENSIFEFFVPSSMKNHFESLMHFFMKEKIITSFSEMPNRLMDKNSVL